MKHFVYLTQLTLSSKFLFPFIEKKTQKIILLSATSVGFYWDCQAGLFGVDCTGKCTLSENEDS